eukprot:TRINITY_DN67298_c6_g2_i1.p1 TRINITY_DN67298_c6_g2~~TRINITY_DN67298_c6_g2_i1.p1  ORF type:complete len:185 (-),score=8.93 TRINITY_DN67298_c6_g2_i1:148-702(-)
MNSGNIRQLAEGLRSHRNLSSVTLCIRTVSYSTASIAFFVSSLPVDSLTTLHLELGACHTALVAAISALLQGPHARLRTLKLYFYECNALPQLVASISDSQLWELDLTISGKWGSMSGFELPVPSTLRRLHLGGHFVTAEFRTRERILLGDDWVVGELASQRLQLWATFEATHRQHCTGDENSC